MVEIDVKINGELFDRIHVCNTDQPHLGLTTYKVETLRKKTFTVQHARSKGLYELLSRVFGHGYLKHSGECKNEKEIV